MIRTQRLGQICDLLPARSVVTAGDSQVRIATSACLSVFGFKINGIKSARMRSSDVADATMRAGEILVARSNTPELVGNVALFNGEQDNIVSGDLLIRLWPRDEIVDTDYLTGFLSNLFHDGYWRERAGGASGTMKKITRGMCEALPVPLPPLAEQRRIAARLREQLAEVEKARTALQGQLDAAEKLSAGQLTHLFGGDAFQQWPHKPFESVAVLQRGHDLPARERTEGIHPVVTSAGIVETHGEFIAKAPGVVTGRSGSIGKVHFIEKDYWPHNTALYVKDFRGNEPRYVYYLMKWVGVREVSSGTGVPTLDRKEVHKLEVPCPPPDVQRCLVAQLDAMQQPTQDLIAQIKTRLQATEKLPAALLREAFSQAA